jgi:hypothetical protein
MKNLGHAISFPFEDKDWIQKILIGAAFLFLSVIVIGLPLLFGYLLELSRRSAAGDRFPLPDWQDIVGMLGKGLVFFVIYLIYAIPLGAIALLLTLIPGVGCVLAATIPILALLFVMPYLVVNYARKGDLDVAFDFGGHIEFIKANITNLLIVTFLSYLIFLISFFGVLAFVLGLLFTLYWAVLAAFYLFGQVFYESESREAVAPAAEDLPPAPPVESAPDESMPGPAEDTTEEGEGPEQRE